MRVGVIAKILREKNVGFIRTDDFREDVFFHFSSVDTRGQRALMAGDDVEFEINELAWIDRKELRCTLVRLSRRPLSKSLKVSDAPELHVKHHPKARQKRPVWRKPSDSDAPASEDTPPDASTDTSSESAE